MANLKKIIKSIDFVLKHVHEGIVIADHEGKVIYVNEANERITNLNNKEILGKKVTDVVPNTSILDVLECGKEKTGVKTKVDDKDVYSNIVPIYENGDIIGSISVFLDITEVVNLTRELNEAQRQIDSLSKQLSGFIGNKDFIVGKNPKMQKILKLSQKAANIISNVLITGESGTGKEVVARFIHNSGPRKDEPFITVNCGAIPGTLLESELFGYNPGAFTGAHREGKMGLFEKANNGTIFLDEIGDMPLSLQVKLLSVLQDKEIRRLGSENKIKLDVRVISATNKPLEEMVTKNTFRDDLYYRLNVIHIDIPPLRERKEDIPIYVKSLLGKLAGILDKKVRKVTPSALRCLINYHFPGNIRELENILEKSLVIDDNGIIDSDDLPPFLNLAPPEDRFYIDFGSQWPSLEEIEKTIIEKALLAYPNKSKVAQILGISRATLYRKIKEMGL